MSWADIVRKEPTKNIQNTKLNNITVGKCIDIKTNIISASDQPVDNDEIIVKNIKCMNSEKINKLIDFRKNNNLNQSKFATAVSIPYSDVRDAELGKEINLSSYQKIFNYIDRHNGNRIK
jgi:hypothetical protein